MTAPAVGRQALRMWHGSRHHAPWTEEEDAVLRADYRGTCESAQDLALRLGRSLRSVQWRVVRIGSVTGRRVRRWTAREESYLQEHAGTRSIAALARSLGRSQLSVRKRLAILHLRNSAKDGWFSAREAATVLGVSRTWIDRELHRGTLQAERYTDTAGATWRITTRALHDYLIDHADRLQGRNLQLRTVVDILTGRL